MTSTPKRRQDYIIEKVRDKEAPKSMTTVEELHQHLEVIESTPELRTRLREIARTPDSENPQLQEMREMKTTLQAILKEFKEERKANEDRETRFNRHINELRQEQRAHQALNSHQFASHQEENRQQFKNLQEESKQQFESHLETSKEDFSKLRDTLNRNRGNEYERDIAHRIVSRCNANGLKLSQVQVLHSAINSEDHFIEMLNQAEEDDAITSAENAYLLKTDLVWAGSERKGKQRTSRCRASNRHPCR